MRRVIGLLLILVLALVGFYGAWPAWTGYRIKTAIDGNDPVSLETSIDFASVRNSLRPVLGGEIQRQLARLGGEGGGIGAVIAGQIRGDLQQRIVDAALARLVTPEGVIRIAREGRSLQKNVERVLIEHTGRGGDGERGGVAGRIEDILRRRTPGGQPPAPAPAPVSTEAEPPRRQPLGVANVKTLRLDGPLAILVGVARDPTQPYPDVTARLAFTGGGWRVVEVIPRIEQ